MKLSKHVLKGMNALEFDRIEDLGSYIFCTFINSEATTTYHKLKGIITCTCFNGSNFGINNKQLCKHKAKLINKLGLKIINGEAKKQYKKE